ncbi:hypothetical protein GCM10022289_19290 [Pedobacter jeongneungensis]|uniref:Uncharacterized protein n=1 Tax=Pedobacter jeongneungensis TaxID=947309 RepID=A0ABP8BCB3_9SPHI
MTIKIIVLATNEQADALIKEGSLAQMPSLQDGWRFDFHKQLKYLKDATAYVLVREDTPDVIEGCMIFQLLDKKKPYMAFLEVAPHNKGDEKKHDHVAGCLIAYAFKLSLMRGVGDYKGMLYFEVGEERKEDEVKLMHLYSSRYRAMRLGTTNMMVIFDENGELLIERYLN